jgi:hypothetical protein
MTYNPGAPHPYLTEILERLQSKTANNNERTLVCTEQNNLEEGCHGTQYSKCLSTHPKGLTLNL